MGQWERIQRLGRRWHEAWLRRRLPVSRSLVLTESRVFILPTRYGVVFGVMAFALFLGGINYANSLMLATSFLLASLFFVSILHTYRNLAGLEVNAGHSAPGFVGSDAPFEVVLRRRGGREYEAVELSWETAAPQTVDINEGAERRVRMQLPVTRRGRYRPGRLKLQTTFPLGVVRAWSWIALEMETLGYPRPLSSEQPPLEARGDEGGERHKREGSADFEGLRTYRPGDNLRHVAWKTYARGGGLHTKEFVAYEDPGGWLAWDALSGDDELRLSQLCYWVLRLSEKGERFGLRLPTLEVEPAVGAAHERRCLEALALFQRRPWREAGD